MTKQGDWFQKELDKGRTPCIPPQDYKGSVAQWMLELQERGIWDGDPDNWYGDIWIDSDTYWEILEACEGVLDGDCSVKCEDDKHHATCRRKQ